MPRDQQNADRSSRRAAVLIPFMFRSGGVSVLFTERHANLPTHGGEVSFPGGTASPADADLVATALRELDEEVGITRGSVIVAGSLPARPTRTGFNVLPVIGVIEPVGPLNPQVSEVQSCFEVPLDFLLSDRNYSRKAMPGHSRDRVFNVIEFDRYTIWGATASMLVDLRKCLENSSS
jgi:8-oxo-dGTP pyrophosphatase MutT (NUDIX family)